MSLVTYVSLSWCRNWHPPEAPMVKTYTPGILRTPNEEADAVTQLAEAYLWNSERKEVIMPSITEYKSEWEEEERKLSTTVVEVEGIKHRDIIKVGQSFTHKQSPFLLNILRKYMAREIDF